MKTIIPFATASLVFGSTSFGVGDKVTIGLAPDHILEVGSISRFDRNQFLLIHGSPDELPAEKTREMLERTRASLARSVNLLSHEFRKIPPDPERPGFKDLARLREVVTALVERALIDGSPAWAQVGLSMHPHDVMRIDPPAEVDAWGGDSDEGRTEALIEGLKILGEAGWKVPFFEPMNEPRTKLEIMNVDWPRVIEFHRYALPRLKEALPGMQIGGYAAYQIRFHVNGFDNWKQFPKRYLDEVGDPVDFYSFHPYAGTPLGQHPRESMAGSVLEGSLDLLAAYTSAKFGKPLPLYISEFGLAYFEGRASSMHLYTPQRDWEIMREINGQLLSYVQRPDLIVRAIPFIVPFWEWWRRSPDSSPETPHSPWALYHEVDGEFVPTHLFKFYELWRDVEGDFVWSSSNDPSVQVAAIRDADRLQIVLHNLSREPRTLTLTAATLADDAWTSGPAKMRSLRLEDGAPVLEELEITDRTEAFSLAAHETRIVETPVSPTVGGIINRGTGFAPETVVPIGDEALSFDVPGPESGEIVQATLRIGFSGEGRLPTPRLVFNGEELAVPKEEIGDDFPQHYTDAHWSVRLVSVPTALVRKDNTVTLDFGTPGGHVSSVALVTDTLKPRQHVLSPVVEPRASSAGIVRMHRHARLEKP